MLRILFLLVGLSFLCGIWSQSFTGSMSVHNHFEIGHKCGKHTRALSSSLVKLINASQGGFKAQTYTVSVVIHDYTNTSDVAIAQMIDQLNSNFSLAVAGGGGDETDIRFCIAKIDPNGDPTTGIIHSTGTSSNNFFGYTVTQTPNTIAIWSPEEYLNVYIVNSIPGSANGVASLPWNYASNPNQPALSNPNAPYNDQLTATLLTTNPAFSALGNKDGIIIESGTINTSQNYVITHEAGHYLGLPHPFSSSSPTSCVDGDGLNCTGNSIEYVPNNCSAPSSCSGMDTQNFMVYGACTPYRYRVCQKDVMRYVLNNQRSGLVNSGKCDKAYDLNVKNIVVNKDDCNLTFSTTVTVKNEGSNTLTQAKLRYQINGGAFVNYTWTGNLTSGSSTTFSLTGLVGINGANSFFLEVRNPNTALNNNKTDQEISNDSKSKNFTMNQPSPVSVSVNNTAICIGESISLSGSGSTSYSWNHSLGTGANKSDSPNVTKTYIVTGTTSGCVTSANVEVVVNQLPIVLSSNLLHETCQDENASFTAVASSGQFPYQYSLANGTYSNNANFSSLDDGVYTLKAKDANNCESLPITINITNTGGFFSSVSNDSSICNGQNVMLEVTTSTSGLTYSWSNSLPSNQTQTVAPTATTTYSVIVADQSGCSRTHSSVITVVEFPIINTSLSSVILCRNETVGVSASGAGAYVWNTNGSNSSTSVTFPSSLDSLSVVGINEGICSTYYAIPIFQSNMNTSITPDATICEGETIEVEVTTTQAPTGGVDYIWTQGLPNSNNHNVSPAVTTVYDVIIQDGLGCEDTLSSEVAVVEVPNLVLSTDSVALCQGDSIVITASGASEFVWGNGEITSSIQLKYPVNIDSIVISGVNGGICFDVESVKIVESFMNNSITQPLVICSGDSVELSVESNDSTLNYLWNNGLSNQSSHVVSPTDTTVYNVVITDFIGCEDELITSIDVLQSPNLSLSNSQIILCALDSVDVIVSGAENYSWNTGDTTSVIKVKYPTGLDSLIVHGVNGGACIRKIGIPIFQSQLDASISGEQHVCLGSSVTLLVVANTAGLNYNWDNGLSNSNFHSVYPSTTTEYNVEVVDALGCVDSLTTTVYVDSMPILVVEPTSINFCEGDSVMIEASGASTYSWSTGDSISSISYVVNHTTTLTLTGMNGVCHDNLSIPVQASPSASVVASSNVTSINTGGSIQFYNTGSTASSYLWDFGDGVVTFLGSPYHMFNFPGAYHVVLTGLEGDCEASDTVLVYVGVVGLENESAVYSEVFPNPSSGHFNIISKEDITSARVYNSLGQLVYGRKQFRIESIDVSFLSEGIYYLELKTDVNKSVQKIQLLK